MNVLQRGDRLVRPRTLAARPVAGSDCRILDAVAKAGVAFVVLKENIRVARARASGRELGRPNGSLGVSWLGR